MTATALVEHIDHFQRRVIQDAVSEATARHWQRRAAVFEWARPRPGDYIGTAGPQRAAEIDARLCASRDACLARATLSILKGAA